MLKKKNTYIKIIKAAISNLKEPKWVEIVVADSGIAKKIPQDLWNIIADELAAGIKTGHTKEGFTGAIEKCGELLAEHFPAHSENPNELPDGLVILTED